MARKKGKSNRGAKSSGASRRNRFRIIAGQWRGRRLGFPDVADLRPTGDRVRETLFNWLMPVIDGARCLDLYAGSGALGLEALSRGAASAVFVDADMRAVTAINDHLEILGAEGGETVMGDARGFLQRAATPYDIVFLDPPFRDAQMSQLCTLLESVGWLGSSARIYLEYAASADSPQVPDTWRQSRSSRAGNVAFSLYVREA